MTQLFTAKNKRHTFYLSSISILFLLVFLFTSISPVHSQSSTGEWKLISQIGGSTRAIAVDGDTAYAGIGLSLVTMDVSDPANPSQLGSSAPFTSMIEDINFSEDQAFVSTGSSGVSIVDVADPAQPEILSTWDSSGFVEASFASGETLFVADGPCGLSLLDISDPTKPEKMASVYDLYNVLDVIVSGDYAYLAAGDSGVLIADISDPTAPVEAAQLDTPGYAYSLSIAEDTLYVADAWEGIAVLDVSDPTEPEQIGNTATTGWAISIAVNKDTLFTGEGGQGIESFDISNPAKITVIDQLSIDGSARQIVVSADKVYAADTLKGLRILDGENQGELTQLGAYKQLPYARRIKLVGEYAYVVSGTDGGMYAVNVSEPAHPYQASMFQSDGNAADVTLVGDYAYLGTFMTSTNCLTVVDVSDPLNPVEKTNLPIQECASIGAPRQAAQQDQVLYIADEFGLSIVDINPTDIIGKSNRVDLDFASSATQGVSVEGNYAYVADASQGLRIIDISDPFNPGQPLTYNNGKNVTSVVVSGNTLYLGYSDSSLEIAAMKTPGAMPAALSTQVSLAQVEEVAVGENQLISSEGNSGVAVYDISDPAKITQVQVLAPVGYSWSTTLVGNILYVAAGDGGMYIYEKEGGTANHADMPVIKTGNSNLSTSILSSSGPVFPESVSRVEQSESCMVSAAADSGAGSLRDCLEKAVAGTLITFDPKVFTPKSPATIQLQSSLPDMDDGSVTIDASNAGVILEGNQTIEYGLKINSAYNTVMGIQFNNFINDGIVIEYPSQYNVIGGDHTVGDGLSGQGNVFNGSFNGVRILFSNHNQIIGNFFGTDAAGKQAGKINQMGIAIGDWATYNQIGGPTEGEKNIISNCVRGIDIASNTAAFNVVAGNYIGTDITGTKAIPNNPWGILIEVGTRNNIIGGTTAAERNVISGNNGWGITISDDLTTQNTIIGNYIGVDSSGLKALPNKTGISMFVSKYNRVGGSLPGEANVISGNTEKGVVVFGTGATNDSIMGNIIGSDGLGEKSLPNGMGIWIYGGTHTFIGGFQPESANQILNNQTGINLDQASTSYNWVAGNTISRCSSQGISLSNASSHNFLIGNSIENCGTGILINQGVENLIRANSMGGNTGGAIVIEENGSEILAAPVLASVTKNAVSGTTCPNCTIEIFSAPQNQSLIYEGFTIADGDGNFEFKKTLSGPSITATTIDSSGNTSEYCAAMPVQ